MILVRISQKPESSRFIFLEPAIYIVLRKYKKLNSLICSEFNLLSHLFSLFSHFCNAHLLFVSRLSTFPSSTHSSMLTDCLFPVSPESLIVAPYLLLPVHESPLLRYEFCQLCLLVLQCILGSFFCIFFTSKHPCSINIKPLLLFFCGKANFLTYFKWFSL